MFEISFKNPEDSKALNQSKSMEYIYVTILIDIIWLSGQWHLQDR